MTIEDICKQLGIDPEKPPIYLKQSQVAQLLHVSPHTLKQWRCHGVYHAPYKKINRNVLYPSKDFVEAMNNDLKTA